MAVKIGAMGTDSFQSWLVNAGLILAGTLALFYAASNSDSRSRNAVFSIVLFSLAVYRIYNLPA